MKELLGIIQKILKTDLQDKRDYNWFEEWQNNNNLAEQLEKIYAQNIYLKQIKKGEAKVSKRMIADTKQSRNPLYREAAQLLSFYHNLTTVEHWSQVDNTVIKDLLKDTFIRPKEDSVLFELYWLIKLINYNTEHKKLHLITEGNNLVASWEDKKQKYSSYHNAVGGEQLNCKLNLAELAEVQNEHLKRKVRATKISHKLSQQILYNKSNKTYWQGRPDILVEVTEQKSGDLEKVIIGEVKYTTQLQTVQNGLEELIDYLILLRDKQGYLADKKRADRVEVEGLLLVDKIRDRSENLVEAFKVYRVETEWQIERYQSKQIVLD